ncbi:3-phosphoshikimate 1-carboxyvinyltransferase [Halobium salinum]|uniref:3-phosphoshikimate 1-carboxyvinyltransferase n=1 Tax=Halobium salinum TaxID=1364940 RepID=A0ABD5P6R9_9EURY|nr:3-phosphoshikimate 1-carboxyvinyltransferase [Halobium salinum]
MDAVISKSWVEGRTRAPPSKSYTHRAILAAGYADGARVLNPLVSADTEATMRSVEAFGGSVERSTDADGDGDVTALDVTGFDGRPGVPDDVIDCANSGTTMRLVTGCAGLADGITVLTGDGSLRSRPQGPLLDALDALGGRAESTRGNGQAPLVLKGPTAGGEVSIPGDVSSQYITALLMAGAVTDEGVDIDLETELKSAPYVDITLELLADFGVEATAVFEGEDDDHDTADATGFHVDGGQSYSPEGGEYHVPGDFSSISYLLAAGAVAAEEGASVVVEGAVPSAQGDTAIVEILERMGADVEWDREAGELVVRASSLSGVEVDVGDTPDLLPTIAVLGAVADGETRITNCEHVRYKETDRVSAMAEELGKMGVEVTEERDVLTVHGSRTDLVGADVDGRADHRIVMSLTVAGLVADGETRVAGAEHVDVSFPDFFETLGDIGADVDLVD